MSLTENFIYGDLLIFLTKELFILINVFLFVCDVGSPNKTY